MFNYRVKKLVTLLFISVLSGCGNSVEGTYTITDGPVKGAVVTLGEDSFSFSSGASGTYEVSGEKVIFSGLTFSGTMRLENGDLINEKWHFSKIH